MIRDYKPSWTEEIVEYNLVFYSEPGCGLAFPCDENGNVNRGKMTDAAIRNLDSALANPGKHPVAWNEVEKRVRRGRNPASGVCDCGKRINLYDSYLGACECPKCGRWWNVFGDALKNPREWKNGGDW